MNETTCPIWDTPAKDFLRTFDGRDVFSARAGGRFQVTESALSMISEVISDRTMKAILSLRISDSQGMDQPLRISTETLRQVPNWPDIRPFDKANRLLRWIEKNTRSLGYSALRWGPDTDRAIRDSALAASGLTDRFELEVVLEYLVQKGFCQKEIDERRGEGFVWLTLEGAEEVSAPVPASQSNQAFIAMWFSPETQSAFDDGINPALADLGFVAHRIDQKEHNNKIDDEIVAEIRQSRFLVADFTCGTTEPDRKGTAIARGGVYFEAGFAMGLGIPVIWCCREDLINQVHFDTRQYNHITWNTPEELREKLKNRVGAVIGSYSGKQHS